MNRTHKNFIIEARTFDIIVIMNNPVVKVIIIDGDTLNIGQQIFNDANLMPLIGSSSFKNISDFYAFLSACSSAPERWYAQDITSLQINSQVKFPLKAVIDPLQISKIAILRASLNTNNGKNADNGNIQQEVASLRSSYNALGPKLKKIGEVVEQLHQTTTQTTRQIAQVERNLTTQTTAEIAQVERKLTTQTSRQIAQVERKLAFHDEKIVQVKTSIEDYGRRAEQSIQSIKLSIDILQKTIQRNNQTLNQSIQSVEKRLKEDIATIWSEIERYDFKRIRRENEQILQLFDLQIKIKSFPFVPDPSLLQTKRNLHWLNKKTLKNFEDVNDYNKIVSQQPLAPGISKLRIIVRNIKNNGLLFGICGRKVKESLQSTTFNDPNMICLNSCGYVINRGAMIHTTAKIKSGDIIKMQMNLNQGVITWFCNDIEVAVADMCPLNKEQVFIVIGLGFFGDQIQVFPIEPPKNIVVEVVHDKYAKELQRMNEKFGSNSKRRY